MKKPTKPSEQKTTALDGWRIFGSTFFGTLAIISLLGYLLVRWTHNYLLNTEQFTAIAAELPKKPEVAAALSKFSTQKLFEAINAQALIAQALPEQAQFLAAPLATQLQSTATTLANNIILSSQFETVWTFVVGNAHTTFLKVVNASPLNVSDDQISKVGLQLGDVVRNVAGQLGRDDIGVAVDKTIGTATEVTLDMRAQIKQIRQAVASVNYLYSILPLLVLTLTLLAVWLSHHMSRVVFSMSLAGILVSGLALVLFKVVKTEIMLQFQDTTYQAAIGVSWDVITEGLVKMFIITAIVSFVVMLLALLFSPFRWATSLRKMMYLDKIDHTRFGEAFDDSQTFVQKYYLLGCGIALVIAIVVLLIMQQVVWVTLLQALMIWLSFCLLLAIFIKPKLKF